MREYSSRFHGSRDMRILAIAQGPAVSYCRQVLRILTLLLDKQRCRVHAGDNLLNSIAKRSSWPSSLCSLASTLRGKRTASSLICRSWACGHSSEDDRKPCNIEHANNARCQVERLDALLCRSLAQLLEVTLGDESFHVSLSNVELAVLGQSDSSARQCQQSISARFDVLGLPVFSLDLARIF